MSIGKTIKQREEEEDLKEEMVSYLAGIYNRRFHKRVKQREEEEDLKEEKMYDEKVSYLGGIDNRRFHKRVKQKKSREFKNEQTIRDQREEILNNPFFIMARKVNESRPTKPKSITKKDTPENVLSLTGYDSPGQVADVLTRVWSFSETPKHLITGQEPLTDLQQNTRSLLNPETRKYLLNESKKLRSSKGTKKKKRKKRKKPQTPRGRRRRRPPTPRRRGRPLTPRRRRRASRKK